LILQEDQGAISDDDGLHGVKGTKKGAVTMPKTDKTKGAHKDTYQCIDCLLLLPGIAHWGCSVAALRTWCDIAGEKVIDQDDGSKKKSAKEAHTLEKEIVKPKTADEMNSFEDSHKAARK
jgi:hypothetical protein